MHWRQRRIFRVAVNGILGALLLAGCSSGTSAPLKSSSQREGYPLAEASPLFEYRSPHKRLKISAGGLEAPETGTTLNGNLLVNGDFSAGMKGWDATTSCFRPDSS